MEGWGSWIQVCTILFFLSSSIYFFFIFIIIFWISCMLCLSLYPTYLSHLNKEMFVVWMWQYVKNSIKCCLRVIHKVDLLTLKTGSLKNSLPGIHPHSSQWSWPLRMLKCFSWGQVELEGQVVYKKKIINCPFYLLPCSFMNRIRGDNYFSYVIFKHHKSLTQSNKM